MNRISARGWHGHGNRVATGEVREVDPRSIRGKMGEGNLICAFLVARVGDLVNPQDLWGGRSAEQEP